MKVLIVDDEPFIIEGLCRVIDWEAQGFEIIHKSHSPLEAFEYLQTTKVDLVITDIKMPEMTGLELLEKVRKELHQDTSFIILSGYNDFGYARKAMQYECLDYLLKPINRQELLNALDKARKQHEQKEQAQEKDDRYQKELFTRNLIPILYGQFDSQNMAQVKQMIGQCPDCRYISIELNSMTPKIAAMTEDQKISQLKQLYNKICSLFPEHELRVLFHLFVRTSSYDIGLILDKEMAQNSILYERVERGEANFIKYLKEYLSDVFDLPLQFFVGNKVSDIGSITRSVSSMMVSRTISNMDALTQYKPDSGSLNLEENRTAKSQADALIAAVEQNNKEDITDNARNLLFTMEKADYANANLIISYIFYSLMHLAYELDQNINQAEIFQSISENALEELFLEENARNVELFLQEYASYLAQLRGNQAKGVLADIENDMRQNYRDNVTLKELSQKYFINAAYLGQIFRKQFNESFKDHLNRIRAEKACDLLIKTDMRIYEIAEEVGYKDLDYFIEKFISFYGVTPAKFRKQTNTR